MVPAVPPLVTDPPGVHRGILPGLEPVDGVLIVFGVDRAAGRAAATDVRFALQEPNPLLVEEILVAECTHGAEVDDIAGEFVVEWIAWEDVDFLLGAAGVHHQFARAGDLAGEPHAPGTHDAAIDKQRDRRTHVPLAAVEGLDVGPPLGLTVLEVVVLQQAFPRLVTDRAVDWVIDEECLLNPSPALDHIRALGDDHRAILDGRLAAGDELRDHRDLARLGIPLAGLNQTHPAACHHREAWVPAVVRNLHSGPPGGLDAVEPLLGADLNLTSIDDDGGH